MKALPSIIISIEDFQKIKSIISHNESIDMDLLSEELDRAHLVMSEYLPKDVVSMNKTVKFLDLDTNKESTVTLVYPEEADINESKISILSPIGSALIGLQIGQTIEWPIGDRKIKKLQVRELLTS
jgi:regulator of nucleoside diphosphate kinase